MLSKSGNEPSQHVINIRRRGEEEGTPEFGQRARQTVTPPPSPKGGRVGIARKAQRTPSHPPSLCLFFVPWKSKDNFFVYIYALHSGDSKCPSVFVPFAPSAFPSVIPLGPSSGGGVGGEAFFVKKMAAASMQGGSPNGQAGCQMYSSGEVVESSHFRIEVL